ncbi:MAG: YeeE/YedE thiosulfate transporter family protein [Flavobacteriaceae bacterium]|nr:YeeE/YedE thiosulfate transporter family protein [Flavobacteriaceae bacterium]
MKDIIYIILGTFLGIVLYKSEAASWFRIYEMFQFDSFHMYGIIGSALVVGIVLVFWIKKFKIKSFFGESIQIEDKERSFFRYILGGTLFGLGWALAGACPGPIYILVGAGYWPIILVLIGAVFGAFIYGVVRSKLPH